MKRFSILRLSYFEFSLHLMTILISESITTKNHQNYFDLNIGIIKMRELQYKHIFLYPNKKLQQSKKIYKIENDDSFI